MNPNCLASTFSVQQVSKHHYLIRGDERIKDYMNFCDVKWSNTYQGWIVHEDDEVDLIQMHMEVMDLAKEERTRSDKKKRKNTKTATAKKSSKSKTSEKKPTKTSKKKLIVTSDEESDEESDDDKPKKKKSGKKGDLYERFKRGEDITDDEDDEYVPSSEPSTETITEESDLGEEDSDTEEEDTEEEEETEEEDSEEEEYSEEEECETDPKRKKEFQFYKKGILAFGKMTDRQQEKLEAIWNKTLRGWIIRMSNLEKLKKQGWTEIDHEEAHQHKHKPLLQDKKLKEKVIDDQTIVHTPKVTKKPKVEEEKTFEKYLFSLLVKGTVTIDQLTQLGGGIYHPGLKGTLVSSEYRDKLISWGFREKTLDTPVTPETKEVKEKEVVRIDFTNGEELKQ